MTIHTILILIFLACLDLTSLSRQATNYAVCVWSLKNLPLFEGSPTRPCQGCCYITKLSSNSKVDKACLNILAGLSTFPPS